MNIFSIFKIRRTKPKGASLIEANLKELTPAAILQLTQDYVPDFYKDSKHFKDSKDFLNHNEWGLALESLIEMANDSGHYFSENFWTSLATCADKMQMTQQAEFCRQQIIRNENELGFKTPKGWTTIKKDNAYFEHHIAEAKKDSESRKKEQTENDFILVTVQKLKIFEKYGGSSGGYDRVKSKDLNILPYSEFMFIDRLVQDIKLVKKGLAAQSYEDEVNKKIIQSCENNDTIDYLRKLADNS